MQTGKRLFLAASVLVAAFAVSSVGHAAIITTSLGNTAPSFNDGDTPPLFPDILNAQFGQPAPFDTGKGSDPTANLNESWLFTYGAIGDPILSASLTLGILDHDSAATGSQLAQYLLDGNDLTSDLDALFEAGGGANGEYNVYTLVLDSSLFAALADGSLTVALALQGPGLQTDLSTGAVSETSFNGAHLIFSTLTIETENGQVPVPGPTSLSLALLAFGTLLWRRREYALGAIRRR